MRITAGMGKVLAELELISHGSTQAWNSAGGGKSHEGFWEPPGEINPPHLTFRRLWLAAADDHARELVRQDAEKTLQAIRGHGIDRSHVIGETREQEDARILKQGLGETPDRVALVFHCTPTRVRRARLTDGRDPETGIKPERTPEEIAAEAETDAASAAVRMIGRGLSQRQVALCLDRPRRTIRDWLEAAKS